MAAVEIAGDIGVTFAMKPADAAILFPNSFRTALLARLGRCRNVIGFASWGSNDGGRSQRWLGFEWLPGAIVTE